ncbi:cytochrome P450 [Leucobacter soli]|uniref:Aromatic O-demethylase, cytochrome P450 subunit n=1 Tax=Leucobacter soli TaxID=2812850 RepID=A0A916K0Y5_9MICO|nr:cytochrome P450 [Leucobacter soli]CAG7618759.1 Aromatic O-demethylase, cytochrome P450 subunit [Leucobacter soli]
MNQSNETLRKGSFRADLLTRAEPARNAFDIVADIPLAELEADPYRFYGWMREECPVVHVPETGRVLVLTWELCREAGINDAVFGPTHDIHEFVYGEGNLMMLKGEEHRKLRAAANSPLRPKQTMGYRDKMREAVRGHLERMRPLGSADAAREIFEPICMRVVGDIAGYGDVDDETLTRWLRTLAARLVDYGRDPEVDRASRQTKNEIRAYLEARLPDLDETPGYTVLGHLRRDGMREGEVRSAEQLQPTAEVLIVGGFQEPAHLVASTLYGLLSHPEQWHRFMEDPAAHARSAIEEGLRWLPPFGMTEKLTTEEVELGGVVIPAGTEIAMVIGSANRDPARFERPDEFDIAREDRDNVSFGFGSHFCIGHNVARTLGEIILSETIELLPNLRLDPDAEVLVSGWQARGPQRLPVRWGA